MFRKGHIHEQQEVNILFNNGGIGDQLARMPAVKYLYDSYPFAKLNVYLPDYFFDLAQNLLPGPNYIKFSEGKEHWKGGIEQRQTSGHLSNFASHLTDQAFYVLCNKQAEDKDKNYLKLNLDSIDVSEFNLPDNYVVVTTGFTAPVREMVPRITNEIIYFLRGRNVMPVFLGSKEAAVGVGKENIIGNFKQEIKYERGLDLINKTTLLQAGKIIAGAKAIVGLDNGLLHLAGCTDIPIVAGFTTVNPFHRLPYRNNQLGWNCYTVIPEESLECRFCQSNWDFVPRHDFKFCFYNDYRCVKKAKHNDYIEHLKKIIDV